MKRKGHIYETMCSPETIRRAIFKAAKRKHKRHDVQRVLKDVETHVALIQEMLEALDHFIKEELGAKYYDGIKTKQLKEVIRFESKRQLQARAA